MGSPLNRTAWDPGDETRAGQQKHARKDRERGLHTRRSKAMTEMGQNKGEK